MKAIRFYLLTILLVLVVVNAVPAPKGKHKGSKSDKPGVARNQQPVPAKSSNDKTSSLGVTSPSSMKESTDQAAKEMGQLSLENPSAAADNKTKGSSAKPTSSQGEPEPESSSQSSTSPGEPQDKPPQSADKPTLAPLPADNKGQAGSTQQGDSAPQPPGGPGMSPPGDSTDDGKAPSGPPKQEPKPLKLKKNSKATKSKERHGDTADTKRELKGSGNAKAKSHSRKSRATDSHPSMYTLDEEPIESEEENDDDNDEEEEDQKDADVVKAAEESGGSGDEGKADLGSGDH